MALSVRLEGLRHAGGDLLFGKLPAVVIEEGAVRPDEVKHGGMIQEVTAFRGHLPEVDVVGVGHRRDLRRRSREADGIRAEGAHVGFHPLRRVAFRVHGDEHRRHLDAGVFTHALRDGSDLRQVHGADVRTGRVTEIHQQGPAAVRAIGDGVSVLVQQVERAADRRRGGVGVSADRHGGKQSEVDEPARHQKAPFRTIWSPNRFDVCPSCRARPPERPTSIRPVR